MGEPEAGAMQPTSAPPTPTQPAPELPAPTTPDEPTAEEKAAKKEAKRQRVRTQVAQEIVATEEVFVRSLNFVHAEYILPLLSLTSDASKCVLSSDQVNSIFANIPVLSGLNANFLRDLQDKVGAWNNDTTKIGPIFIQFAPFFKMYVSYVNNHDSALQTLRQQLKSNSKFTDFCTKVMTNPDCKGLALESFLIMPVQRIPRYKLLLQELLKHTPEDHCDREELQQALSLAAEVGLVINEEVRARENRDTIIGIQDKFAPTKKGGGGVQFVSPSRVFVKQGKLTKKCRAKDIEYEFFLFNDLLVYASTTNLNKFKLHQELPIDNRFSVEDLPSDAKNPTHHRFQIRNAKKSFEVFTDSTEGKSEWLGTLYDCIQSVREKAKCRGESGDTFVAPVWQGDKSSSNCSCCDRGFTVFTRRHHCRVCGALVCNDCSKMRAKLKTFDKVQRVCDRCVMRLNPRSDDKPETDANEANRASSERVRVIHGYTAVNEGDLDLKEGEVLTLDSRNPGGCSDGWWEGTNEADVRGIFPASFVQLISCEGITATEAHEEDSSSSDEEQASSDLLRAKSVFDACSEQELAFNEGDVIRLITKDPSGWWLGRHTVTDDEGWFPPEYVEAYTPPKQKHSPQPQPVPTPSPVPMPELSPPPPPESCEPLPPPVPEPVNESVLEGPPPPVPSPAPAFEDAPPILPPRPSVPSMPLKPNKPIRPTSPR